jgi:hypothetical protein
VAEPKKTREPVAAPATIPATTTTATNTSVTNSSANTTTTKSSETKTKKSFLSGYKANVGFTFGDIDFKDESGDGLDADFVPTLGYMIGLAKDFSFGENFVVQPGVALIGFGSKVADMDYTYNIHYLSLHGTGQYRTPFKVYAGLGLFLDFGLLGSQGYPSGNSSNLFKSGGFVRMNSGLNFEVGYPLSFDNKSGDVFVSYRKGLKNVEDDDAAVGQTTKLNMVTIGVRYDF